MCSVAESVEEGNDIIGQIVLDGNDIGCGDAEILCKSAVAVDADALCLLAPLAVAGAAVIALAADDVALAGNALADLEVGYALAKLGDLADIFMADRKRRVQVLLCPAVPLVDMYVCSADSRLADLDKNLAGAGFGNRYLCQDKAGPSYGLYKCIHHL